MILNMAGGGGAGLNFSVKAYASELALPATAAENTIAVITDTAITDWVFVATEPTTRSDGTALSGGEVWIATGSSSAAAFNAAKKNSIWLYPTSCSQYVGGAWAPKTAKIYQSGAWKLWETYLYSPGNVQTANSGGWESIGRKWSSGRMCTATAPTVLYNNDNMYIQYSTTSNLSGIAKTVNLIDLSSYSMMYLDVLATGIPWTDSRFCAWSSIGTYVTDNISAYNTIPAEARTIVSVDLSAINNNGYIGVALGTKGSSIDVCIYNLWLER